MDFEQYYNKIENVSKNHYFLMFEQKQIFSSTYLGSKKYVIE